MRGVHSEARWISIPSPPDESLTEDYRVIQGEAVDGSSTNPLVLKYRQVTGIPKPPTYRNRSLFQKPAVMPTGTIYTSLTTLLVPRTPGKAPVF
jgi:hypothetical protein